LGRAQLCLPFLNSLVFFADRIKDASGAEQLLVANNTALSINHMLHPDTREPLSTEDKKKLVDAIHNVLIDNGDGSEEIDKTDYLRSINYIRKLIGQGDR
jgi:hypothetical protein